MKLKPFKWFEETGAVADHHTAVNQWSCYLMGGWGGYAIREYQNGKFTVWVGGIMESGQFPTFAAAEKFTRDDFERRIRREIEQ